MLGDKYFCTDQGELAHEFQTNWSDVALREAGGGAIHALYMVFTLDHI